MEVHTVTADGDTITDDARRALRDEPAVVGSTTFTCNSYLALGERDTLVDAGSLPEAVDVVREHTRTLDAVVITHQHGDHVAELDAVLDAFDADCYAYADHPRRTHALEDGDAVRIGDEVFEAVYTPGHADDHLAFASGTTLFSGDVVVYNDGAYDDGSFGKSAPGPARERLVGSLETLLERLPDGVERLYAGHGDPFRGDVHAVVERALERARRGEPKY